jgi:hypothetical protein
MSLVCSQALERDADRRLVFCAETKRDLAGFEARSGEVTTAMEVMAMRRRVLSVPVLAVALVGAVAAAPAHADGLPVLGVDVGSSGVASSNGARYVTIPTGSRTIVARVAQRGGQVLAWRSLRGSFTIPAVAYDGSASGLSADGKTLVLIEPRTSFPRRATKLLALRSDGLQPDRVVKLQGDFSFDAVSPDGSWLYLIHYVSPNDPTRYLVQAYDLRRGRLLAKPIIDPHQPGEKMRGNPLSRTISSDGRWAYTLYDGAGATPFVHALDTVARAAHCIDLDGIAAGTDLSQLRLGIDRNDKNLVVRNNGSPLFLVDLRTLHVARATGAVPASGGTRQLSPPLLLLAGCAALGAIAVGVIRARRKQRRTVIRSLDHPHGEVN